MSRSDQSTIAAFRAFVDELPVDPHQGESRAVGAPRRRFTPWLAAAAVAVIILTTVLIGRHWSQPPTPAPSDPPGEIVLPTHLASHSRLTASIGDSPPGTALLGYQHGHDVELFDSSQYVVMGTNGRSFRQVGVAVERAGTSLLSPDGTTLAIGAQGGIDGVLIMDLATGGTRNLRLPAGGTTVPVLWSPDGSRLWLLRGDDTYRGENSAAALTPRLEAVDVRTGTVATARVKGVVYAPLALDGSVPGVAMAADGLHLAIQVADGQLVLDTATLEVVAKWRLTGQLVTNGWAPDGRSVLSWGVGGVVRQSLKGIETVATASALNDQGTDSDRVLGWTSSHEVLMTRGAGTGGETTQILRFDTMSGQTSVLSTLDTDWSGAGISSISMATGLADDLVNAPVGDVDRGPLSLGWLVGFGAAAALAALMAWSILRRVARRLMRPI